MIESHCASLAQVYPCRLSVLVLPAQQVLEAATLVDCARRLCAVYGAPWHITFKLQVSGCFCKLHPGSCFAGCARAPLQVFKGTSLQPNAWRCLLPCSCVMGKTAADLMAQHAPMDRGLPLQLGFMATYFLKCVAPLALLHSDALLSCPPSPCAAGLHGSLLSQVCGRHRHRWLRLLVDPLQQVSVRSTFDVPTPRHHTLVPCPRSCPSLCARARAVCVATVRCSRWMLGLPEGVSARSCSPVVNL